MTPLALVLFAAALAALAFFLTGIWSARVHFAKARSNRSGDAPPTGAWPGVSLLKPLKGEEEELAENLRSFYRQDYPGPFEVVFATTAPDDPALAIARRVAAEHPHVPTRFVRSDPGFGLNPKVANLAGALAAARHELCLQTDANVRVEPGYLRTIVGELLAEDADLLGSVVVGRGERTSGAALENLQLSAYIAPAVCTALHVAGVPCILGKAMLFRRSALAEVGGLEAVRDVLCEDFVLTQRFREAGRRVVLSASTVANVNRDLTLDRFVARHARWLKMRAVIHVGSFLAELAANPVAIATAALLVARFQPTALALWSGIVAAKVGTDAWVVRLTRGTPARLRHLLLVPLKDLLMVAVWVHSAFSRTVVWRGQRLRFGKGSVLRPDDGPLLWRWVRRAALR